MHLIVYPAMWVEPHRPGTIFVSDAYLKYAKPYAVQKIIVEAGSAIPAFYGTSAETVQPYDNEQADEAWREVISYADSSARRIMDQLIAAGVDAPDVVGYELEDDKGASIGEAELAWEQKKIVYLLPAQEQYASAFNSAGWFVLTDNNPLNTEKFK